jgi:hypothetical protein
VVVVFADRDPHRIVKNLTSTQHIKTTITFWPALSTNFDIRRNEMKSSESFPTLTYEQENNSELNDRRWKMIVP